jgi:acetylglutamate kinase
MIDAAINKASALVEALSYIQRFHNKPQMVLGRRYTDERTLAIAEHVLCNQINRFIVNFIQGQGCEAMGLHSLSSVVLFAEKTYVQTQDGRRVDLGYVGEVTSSRASRRLPAIRRAGS